MPDKVLQTLQHQLALAQAQCEYQKKDAQRKDQLLVQTNSLLNFRESTAVRLHAQLSAAKKQLLVIQRRLGQETISLKDSYRAFGKLQAASVDLDTCCQDNLLLQQKLSATEEKLLIVKEELQDQLPAAKQLCDAANSKLVAANSTLLGKENELIALRTERQAALGAHEEEVDELRQKLTVKDAHVQQLLQEAQGLQNTLAAERTSVQKQTAELEDEVKAKSAAVSELAREAEELRNNLSEAALATTVASGKAAHKIDSLQCKLRDAEANSQRLTLQVSEGNAALLKASHQLANAQQEVQMVVSAESRLTKAVQGSISLQHKLEGAEAQNLSLTAQVSKRENEVESAVEHLVAARKERKDAVSATERTRQDVAALKDQLTALKSKQTTAAAHAMKQHKKREAALVQAHQDVAALKDQLITLQSKQQTDAADALQRHKKRGAALVQAHEEKVAGLQELLEDKAIHVNSLAQQIKDLRSKLAAANESAAQEMAANLSEQIKEKDDVIADLAQQVDVLKEEAKKRPEAAVAHVQAADNSEDLQLQLAAADKLVKQLEMQVDQKQAAYAGALDDMAAAAAYTSSAKLCGKVMQVSADNEESADSKKSADNKEAADHSSTWVHGMACEAHWDSPHQVVWTRIATQNFQLVHTEAMDKMLDYLQQSNQQFDLQQLTATLYASEVVSAHKYQCLAVSLEKKSWRLAKRTAEVHELQGVVQQLQVAVVEHERTSADLQAQLAHSKVVAKAEAEEATQTNFWKSRMLSTANGKVTALTHEVDTTRTTCIRLQEDLTAASRELEVKCKKIKHLDKVVNNQHLQTEMVTDLLNELRTQVLAGKLIPARLLGPAPPPCMAHPPPPALSARVPQFLRTSLPPAAFGPMQSRGAAARPQATPRPAIAHQTKKVAPKAQPVSLSSSGVSASDSSAKDNSTSEVQHLESHAAVGQAPPLLPHTQLQPTEVLSEGLPSQTQSHLQQSEHLPSAAGQPQTRSHLQQSPCEPSVQNTNFSLQQAQQVLPVSTTKDGYETVVSTSASESTAGSAVAATLCQVDAQPDQQQVPLDSVTEKRLHKKGAEVDQLPLNSLHPDEAAVEAQHSDQDQAALASNTEVLPHQDSAEIDQLTLVSSHPDEVDTDRSSVELQDFASAALTLGLQQKPWLPDGCFDDGTASEPWDSASEWACLPEDASAHAEEQDEDADIALWTVPQQDCTEQQLGPYSGADIVPEALREQACNESQQQHHHHMGAQPDVDTLPDTVPEQVCDESQQELHPHPKAGAELHVVPDHQDAEPEAGEAAPQAAQMQTIPGQGKRRRGQAAQARRQAAAKQHRKDRRRAARQLQRQASDQHTVV